MNKKNLAYLFIVLGVFSRFLPHLPNFSPLHSVALFSGAKSPNKIGSLVFFIASLLVTDVILNTFIYNIDTPIHYFTSPLFLFTFLGHLVVLGVGAILLKTTSIKRLLLSSGVSAVLFFLFSNFGVWIEGTAYTLDLQGLGACYLAGLPFLKYTAMSLLGYNALYFGLYYYAFERQQVQKMEELSVKKV